MSEPANKSAAVMQMPTKHKAKPRVLIIDDEEIILEILEAYLEDSYDVTKFEDPAAAMALMEVEQFDLILTDYTMVGKTALDVIACGSKYQKEPLIIVLTGETKNSPEASMCIEAGAAEIIEKPFQNSDEILESIHKCIEAKQRKKAI